MYVCIFIHTYVEEKENMIILVDLHEGNTGGGREKKNVKE
jgi:hypothetical protein